MDLGEEPSGKEPERKGEVGGNGKNGMGNLFHGLKR